MTYTLGTAAKAAGVAKSTIYRAIRAGRISATKTDTGDWSIDPAELHRVFPPSLASPPEQTSSTDLARLEIELAALKETATLLRSQLDDVRTDRDAWRDQAQQAQRLLTNANSSRGFLSKLFAR